MTGSSLPVTIIPVYDAYEQLAACLESIDSASPDIEVLLIDDGSPDNRVLPLLESWVARSPRRSLLCNDRNRGFVFTVNRGMSEVSGDVVLLNSDTLVTPGWLEAMVNCLASSPDIATVTPWSNNGEIVSFPEFCVAAPVPADPAGIARAMRDCGTPIYPEIPTAVGFCMAISRSAISRIGLLDEATFGHGYGEENDFSMRARALGMKNVLCDNAFVAHVGGSSFRAFGLQPDSASMERLLAKHPGYLALVEDFIDRDPLSIRRRALIDAVQRKHAGLS
jgi:GT2 family glycosyltransferase